MVWTLWEVHLLVVKPCRPQAHAPLLYRLLVLVRVDGVVVIFIWCKLIISFFLLRT